MPALPVLIIRGLLNAYCQKKRTHGGNRPYVRKSRAVRKITTLRTIFKFEYPERATTQKTTHKTTQKTIQNLTEQQQAILLFLKEHPEATRKEISESLSNITEDGVKYNLSRLQELGLLKRIGGRKQGYWQIIETVS